MLGSPTGLTQPTILFAKAPDTLQIDCDLTYQSTPLTLAILINCLNESNYLPCVQGRLQYAKL